MSPDEKIAVIRAERRRSLRIRSAIIGALLLVVGGYHFYCWFRVWNHLRKIKADGYATSYEAATREFESLKNTSSSTPAFLAVLQYYTNTNFRADLGAILAKTNGLGIPRLGALREEDFRKALATNQALIDSLSALTNKSPASFDLKWTEGLAMLLKPESQISSLTKLVQIDAVIALIDGDKARTLRDIEWSLAIPEALAKEPLLISSLIRNSARLHAGRLVELSINNFDLSAEELARLAVALDLPSIRRQYFSSLAIERVMMNDIFAHPFAPTNPLYNEGDGIGLKAGVALLIATGIWQRDQFFYLQRVHGMELAEHKLDPAAYFAIENEDALVEDNKSEVERRGFLRINVMSGMTLPALGKAAKKIFTGEAQLRATQALVAAQRFRQKEGHYPNAIKDVVPLLPTGVSDPFSDEPLHFVKDEKTLTIYSVGVDGEDDDGTLPNDEPASLRIR